MATSALCKRQLRTLTLLTCSVTALFAQTTQSTSPQPKPAVTEPTPQDLLRGSYGPYRANNDLLYYHLDLRVDPDKKFISGTNTIRFKMLEDGTRIQLELYPTLQIEKITLGPTTPQVRPRRRNLLCRLPEYPPQRPDLLHRRSLLR